MTAWIAPDPAPEYSRLDRLDGLAPLEHAPTSEAADVLMLLSLLFVSVGVLVALVSIIPGLNGLLAVAFALFVPFLVLAGRRLGVYLIGN